MRLVFGALFDPSFQELDLVGCQRFLRFGWWHDFRSQFGVKSRNQFAFGEGAGSDGLQVDRWLTLIES